MKKHYVDILQNLTSVEISSIIKRIVYLRCNIMKLSQQKFANQLEISQTYLSLIEQGKKPLSSDIISKIITKLQINPDWLIYGESEQLYISDAISSHEVIIRANKDEALNTLKLAYSLTDADISLIQRYLDLPDKQRNDFQKAINSMLVV